MFHQNPHIFDILFEAIAESVIIVNDEQLIVAANTSVEKMFGYNKDELINQPLSILLPHKYRAGHKNNFNSFLEKKTARKIKHGSNLYGITKKNRQFPVEIGLNPFKLKETVFVIALIIDISQRKETEEKIERLNANLEEKIKQRTAELNNIIKQLKEVNLNYKQEIIKRIEAENKIKAALQKEIELNELKTKFLSLVSHEFKTPLSGISTSAMLLNKYQLTEQQQNREKHINIIENKVNYLNNIINDFLSVEQLDSNKANYNFTSFNLSKIVNEVVYSANLLLKSGQKINIPENIDEFVLYQDEKIVELALSNIIYNAIKYSPENTEIDLEVNVKNKNIVFKITDQGIGIPEKDQKFIFNRYFRAENVLNNQGTGIGLNIVKSHLENLGGTVTFISNVNEGSVFTFELPISTEL